MLLDQALQAQRNGRLSDAERIYRQIISGDPQNFDALHMLGVICSEQGDFKDAEEFFRRAVSIDSRFPPCLHNFGLHFAKRRQYAAAVEQFDKALSLAPKYAPALSDRGNALIELGRLGEALRCYEQLFGIAPGFKYLPGNLLYSKMLCCDWKNLASIADAIEEAHQQRKPVTKPFGYQAIARSARQLQVCSEIYAADKFPRTQPALWQGDRYSNPKIRIGYLSGEFRDHVTSKLMVGLFECHDKSHFDIVALDNGWDDGSALRARILRACGRVIDISQMNDQKTSDVIKENQIDILVNLNGYFGHERTSVFSNRPAPIQVSYLGYSGTMGADYIDYIIADRYVIPVEYKNFYTEKVAYLPNCYQISDDKRSDVARAASRREYGLPDSGFVFCCFNNSFKITPELFDVWMRLLDKVENSVLWLAGGDPDVGRNLRAEAARRGIASDRVVVASRTKDNAEYFGRYLVADLFLDTYPFNAGATANDALWFGLPILTCSGEPYTARMAGSLLNAVELPELVTRSLEEYEAAALELARNPPLVASFKARLALNRDSFPLFNTKAITRHIENAYVLMHERFRAGLPPDDIDVPETASLLPSGRRST